MPVILLYTRNYLGTGCNSELWVGLAKWSLFLFGPYYSWWFAALQLPLQQRITIRSSQ
jgi:hypothetical protein